MTRRNDVETSLQNAQSWWNMVWPVKLDADALRPRLVAADARDPNLVTVTREAARRLRELDSGTAVAMAVGNVAADVIKKKIAMPIAASPAGTHSPFETTTTVNPPLAESREPVGKDDAKAKSLKASKTGKGARGRSRRQRRGSSAKRMDEQFTQNYQASAIAKQREGNKHA